MPELEDVPILVELGEQLKAGFQRHEARRRPARASARGRRGGRRSRSRFSRLGRRGRRLRIVACIRGVLPAAGRKRRCSQRYRYPKPHQFIFVRWVDRVLLPVAKSSSTPGLLPVRGSAVADALVTIGTWESWSATRTGEIVTRILKVGFPTAAARARWVRFGRPPLFATWCSAVRRGLPRSAGSFRSVSRRARCARCRPSRTPCTSASSWSAGRCAATFDPCAPADTRRAC